MLRALWRRKLVLIACVIVGGLAALPLALRGPSTFTSSSTVFIPPTNPLPGSVGLASSSSGSLVNVLLDDYLTSDLAGDVREEVSDGGAVTTVTVDQSADLTSYTITATAKDSEVAQEAAEAGGRLVIGASNRIATSLVRRLAVELETSLGPLSEDIAQLQEDLETLRAKIEVVESDEAQLRIRLNSLDQAAARAEAAGDSGQQSVYEERASETREELDELIEQENGLQRKLAATQAKATVAQTRSTALGNIVTQAEGNRAARFAGSSVIDAPSEPATASIVSTLLTILLAMLVAALVGALVVLFLERSAIFSGRRRRTPVEDAA